MGLPREWKFLSSIIWMFFLPLCKGFPEGAPLEACPAMVPLHQGIQPVSTPAPFIIKVEQTSILPGQTIAVSLETLPQKFRYFQGFLIVAVSAHNFMEKVGSFATKEEKYVPCGSNAYSAVTHSSRRKKTSVTLGWTPPPEYQGPIIFVATFVENFSTFWVRQQSSVVTISAAPLIQSPPIDSSDSSVSYETGNIATPIKLNVIDKKNNAEDRALEIYNNCDVTKGCYGEPTGCIKTQSCEIVVSFAQENNNINFELLGPSTGWIAVGLSKDNKMGDDSVMECVSNKKDGTIKVFTSFNLPGYKNQRLELPQEGLRDINSQQLSDKIYCRFKRQGMLAVHGIHFDLLHESHYLFLASGSIKSNTIDQLQQHTAIPYRSLMPVMLTSVSSISGVNDNLIYAHGCLMLIAWIGTASVAIFLARFYKYTWTEMTHCGEKIWFTWHRALNIMTVVLTSLGIILIFSYVQGWSKISAGNAHPILGIIATILIWIQPVMAIFRPHPGTPNRPIFNWCHFLVGNGARLLAVSTLFLAQTLQKASLPSSFSGVLIAFVLFEIVIFFIMEAYSCLKARNGRDQIPLKEMPLPTNIPEGGQPQKIQDAPGSRFRKTVLIVYTSGIIILLFSLLLITLMSSMRNVSHS